MRRRLLRLERLATPQTAAMPGIAIVIDDEDIPPGEAREEGNPAAPVRTFRVHPDSDIYAALEGKGITVAYPEVLSVDAWAQRHGAGRIVDEGDAP